MARNLSAVPKAKRPAPAPDLRESVDAAIAEMDWLTDTDKSLADLARNYAAQIEESRERLDLINECWAEARGDRSLTQKLQKLEAMCDVAKMVGWLGPQLQGVLRDLGGTPASRKAFKPDQPIGGRLSDIRARASRGPRGDGSAGVDAT